MPVRERLTCLREPAARIGRLIGLILLDIAIVLVLVASPALFFWRHLSTNPADVATFPLGDFTELHYPYRHWAAEELAQGRLPTWNPYVSAGHPSIGDIQFGLLYPIGRWVASWGGGELSVLHLEQQVVLHFSIAAVGTYLFARAVGTGRAGGALAALVFAFSGYMTSFPVQQIIIGQVSVWLPWVLLGLEIAIRRREPLGGVLVAAATAMAALVGHPQTLGYVVLCSAAYGLYRLAVQPSLRGALGAACGGLVGLGMAAPALLPALEHLRLTARTEVGYGFTAHGFVPHELLGLLLPTDLGGRALYVGLPVLALAALAVAERRRHTGFWATALGVALVLALGGSSFLYPALYALVPGLQFFRNHERAALISSFALAVLAGHGVGVVTAAMRASTVARGVVAVAAALAVFGLFLQYAVMTAQGDLRNQLGAVADRAFLTALFGVLCAALLATRGARVASVGLVALAGLDLFTAGWQLNVAPGSPERLLRATPTVQFLRDNLGPLDRVSSEGVLPADGNMGALFRVADIVGNSPLDLEAYRVFGDRVDEFQRWRMLSVRYLVTKRKIEDSRIPRVYAENDLNTHELRRDLKLPRAWLVHRAVVANDRDEELDLTRRIKPDEEVVLASAVGALDGRAPDRPVGEGTDVTLAHYEPERLRLRSWSSRDAVLVLGERDYPGWSATVDGQPTPVVRANYVLRAVYLPAGRHEIELRFEPPGFVLGQRWADRALEAAIWLVAARVVLGLLGWAAITAAGILRRRREVEKESRIAASRLLADPEETVASDPRDDPGGGGRQLRLHPTPDRGISRDPVPDRDAGP